MWKKRVNTLLGSTTGYRLVRAQAPKPTTPTPEMLAQAEARRAAKKAAEEKRAADQKARAEKRAAQQAAAVAAAVADALAAAEAAAKKRAPQYDEPAEEIMRRVKPRTMTGREKLFGLISAARYVTAHQVPGDVVECGVWRGGSMQAAALALIEAGDTSRTLHLFDTFAGMTEPTEKDVRFDGVSAEHLLATYGKDTKTWAIASFDDVQEGMSEVDYPQDQIVYHPGRVEDTIPAEAPETIAILRLDTDWYESTKHELEHLYHRLSPGGVLIIDDYGYFVGSRLATDEFLEITGEKLLLIPINSGRIAVKPWA
jgi:O-methyltransferase